MASTYLWGIPAGLLTAALYIASQMPDAVQEVPESEAYCSVNADNPMETKIVDSTSGEAISKTLSVDNTRKDGHTVIATDADLSSKFTYYIDYTDNGFENDGTPTCLVNVGQPEGSLYQVKFER